MITQSLVNSERSRCPPRLAWTGFHPARSTNVGWKTPSTLHPESQLTDISHTPNEQVGSGPRHAPPGVRLDPDNPLPFARRKGEPDFPRYGLTATYTRVADLVHRREDVPWTDAQLSAVVCSTCENQTIIEKGRGMELSAREPATIELPLLIFYTRRGVWMISLYPPSPMSTPIWPRKLSPTPSTRGN